MTVFSLRNKSGNGIETILRRGPTRLERREWLEGYLFIAPWWLGFIIFTAGPFLAAIYLSMTKYDLVTSPRFIGAANYMQMLQDPLIFHSLQITAVYAVAGVILRFIVGLFLAILVNQKVPIVNFFRTAYELPTVITGVAVALMWQRVFHAEFGMVNNFLKLLGIQGPAWFGHPDWVVPTFILLNFWEAGRTMVIYLAGLQTIPNELYEAATVDGAGNFRKFQHITLPLLTPVIFFQIVLGIISSFQVFALAYIITQGGPANSSLFYVLYIYRQGFQYLDMGYASAMAEVLFLIILGITLVLWLTSGRWVFYMGEIRK